MSAIAVVFLFVECADEKVSTLKELESFSEEIKFNSDNYTQEEWDIAKNQFDIICEELDNYEYTEEELKYIGEMKGECTALFVRQSASDFENQLNGLGQELKGFIEGFTDGF